MTSTNFHVNAGGQINVLVSSCVVGDLAVGRIVFCIGELNLLKLWRKEKFHVLYHRCIPGKDRCVFEN